MQFFTNLEAVEKFVKKPSTLDSIDGSIQWRKFEKSYKGSNIVIVWKRNILVIIDKSVSLRRNPLKAMVITKILFREPYIISLIIMFLVLLLYLLLFLVIVFISPATHFEVFQSQLFCILYGVTTQKIDISMVDIKQMVWEPIKYLIIFLIYLMWAK